MAEQVFLEVDEGLVKEEAQVEGTRVVMMVDETREERMERVARWYNRAQPGYKPMTESTEGGAMMESWLMTTRGQQTEKKPLTVEP